MLKYRFTHVGGINVLRSEPDPPQGGATTEIPPYPEETYRGFEQQVKLRGEREYQRKIRRMRELGLL